MTFAVIAGHDVETQAKVYQLIHDIVNTDLEEEEISALEHMVQAFRSTRRPII